MGSFNYAYRTLDGVENSGFTNAQTTSIFSDNGNLIVEFAGKQVTFDGKVVSGKYVDVIVNRDYIEARLDESIAGLFINEPIVPYTMGGARMIEDKMRQMFSAFGVMGIIAPVETEDDKKRSDLNDYQYKITLPESIDDIPENERNKRNFPFIKFSARLRGMINTVYDIDGELT
ncbi:MAG: DUF3383 domain-containing protein [Leptospira sp.]|nr:DUF3383 domain-containing protein [Leptospira sp.]